MLFVSHSQADEAAHSNFCLTLEVARVEWWDPKTLAAGQSLADQLRQAMRDCDACVFLATRRSVDSKWCMAELGAFWGARKQVIAFVADPDVTEEQLPEQFKGNLWTRDARKVLEAVKRPSPALNEVLTPDLVLLLRYLDRDDRWILPDTYGKAMAVANGLPENIDEAQLRGWKRAVRYGLLYLSSHGLVLKQADTSVTYSISKYGKEVLSLAEVRRRFQDSFDRVLHP